MSNEIITTIVGNLTADPELRFTANGDAVANFTIASTPQKYNRETEKFEDGDTTFVNCSVWKDFAENVADTLTKGMRVVAQGALKTRTYENKDGETRLSVDLDVNAVGPDLRWATAKVTRVTNGEGGGSKSRGRGRDSDYEDREERSSRSGRSSRRDDDRDDRGNREERSSRGRSSRRDGDREDREERSSRNSRPRRDDDADERPARGGRSSSDDDEDF